VLLALPPLIFMVFLPYFILVHITPTIENQAKVDLRIDLESFLRGVIVFGLALAIFSAVQGWAYRWSIVKPIGMAARRVTFYVFLLFIIGIGNPWTFGLTNVVFNFGKSNPSLGNTAGESVSFTLISQFFALMLGIGLALKIAQDFMKYIEDRRWHMADSGPVTFVEPKGL
jgi:hypothetical protein